MSLIKIDPALGAKTPEQTESLRRAAYQVEADPLFFKAQRGEATQADWLAKLEEIRARYPTAEPTIEPT